MRDMSICNFHILNINTAWILLKTCVCTKYLVDLMAVFPGPLLSSSRVCGWRQTGRPFWLSEIRSRDLLLVEICYKSYHSATWVKCFHFEVKLAAHTWCILMYCSKPVSEEEEKRKLWICTFVYEMKESF